jgi:hypothetical protein
MTKTVVKKVSSNVKVLRPGSKPLTQSNTEKAKIAAKAKTKTPAARAETVRQAKSVKRNEKLVMRNIRRGAIDQTRLNAQLATNKLNPGKAFTPAQIKEINKAVAVREREIKKQIAEGKAKSKASRATKARGGAPRGGNIGSIGGPGMNWETK